MGHVWHENNPHFYFLFCFFYSNKLRQQQTNESEKQRSSFISPAASALMDHDITTNLNRPTRLSWKSLHFVMADCFFPLFFLWFFYSSRDYYILSLETANPTLEYNSIRKKKKITPGKFQKNKKETDAGWLDDGGWWWTLIEPCGQRP